MPELRFPDKAPAEERIFGIGLAKLIAPGHTLSAATWTIAPSGLTQLTSSIDLATARALVKVAGGTLGTDYRLTCRFTTSDGQIRQRDVRLRIVPVKPAP